MWTTATAATVIWATSAAAANAWSDKSAAANIWANKPSIEMVTDPYFNNPAAWTIGTSGSFNGTVEVANGVLTIDSLSANQAVSITPNPAVTPVAGETYTYEIVVSEATYTSWNIQTIIFDGLTIGGVGPFYAGTYSGETTAGALNGLTITTFDMVGKIVIDKISITRNWSPVTKESTPWY